MKNIINEFIEVYKYLFNKNETDINIQPGLGLVLGIMEWSSLSGEAQEILKDTISEDPIEKIIKEKFIDAPPKDGNKWFSFQPVTIGGSLSKEYSDVFYKLAEKSKKAQYKKIQEYSFLFNRYVKVLDLTEPNLQAVVFCRTLQNTISEAILKELVLAKYNSSAEVFEDALAGTVTENFYLLDPGTRVVPGRTIKLGETFPWLFSIDKK